MLKDMKDGEEFEAKSVDMETYYHFMKWGSRLWHRDWNAMKGMYEWVECQQEMWGKEWNDMKGMYNWYRVY